MTPAQSAVIAAAKALVAGRTPWHYENAERLADLECAIENLEMDLCEATMEHHHGRLTCCRPNGHTEVRHRDYLRGEWTPVTLPTPGSIAERLSR